jgi:two-component system, cell cycle sensor histidine kinase and response regulator CckA
MSALIRVLMVEDSEDDAALITRELRRGGYELESMRVDCEQAMLAALNQSKWDLVISDFSMPHFTGTDALKLLRASGSDVPLIFVSGTIGEDTAVAALKNGAQDYIMKGNLKRLLPAIQRELLEIAERQKRRQLELEVQRLQRFEGIGRLAGGIAHDFNNALGVIVGWAELGYEQAPADSPSREAFQNIRDQAKRSAGLTSQLLAFARRQVLQPRNLEVNKLLSETVDLLRSVMGKHIELKIFLTTGSNVVSADPTQLEQVIMNLCLNARDAMPKGGQLVIETQNVEFTEEHHRLYSQAKPGNYLSIRVADTGTGMDAATLDRIFEPFFTTKEAGKGTGLGLATVYGIAQQHGGFVMVESELGRGTTFRVNLPLGTGMPDRQTVTPMGKVRGGAETILVADDQAPLQELVRVILESRGYRVLMACNGEEAVRLFEANWQAVDLVLLDVMMPELDGPEAYCRMSAVRDSLPVIFTTGHAADAVLLNSTIDHAGAVFLQKPYTPENLCRAVRERLDKARASGSPSSARLELDKSEFRAIPPRSAKAG